MRTADEWRSESERKNGRREVDHSTILKFRYYEQIRRALERDRKEKLNAEMPRYIHCDIEPTSNAENSAFQEFCDRYKHDAEQFF